MHSEETLSQFSTIDALMQGIYDGPATFARVREYGDFGIGTVNHLDGEMLGLDGVFYQITSDGKVHVIPDSMKTSFTTVSFFFYHGLVLQGEATRPRAAPPFFHVAAEMARYTFGLSEFFLVDPYPRDFPTHKGQEHISPASPLPPPQRGRQIGADL